MKKIKCMIVDDQVQSTELMVDHLKNIPFLDLTYSTTNPINALAFLDNEKVDCIFLDIEMPQLNGLEFIEALKAKYGNDIPKIILITGYSQYAVSGYDYGVFDYLLKPVTFKRFKISVDRLVEKTNSANETRDFLFIDHDGQKVKVSFNEIIYIEGAGNYIYVITSQKKMIFYKTMNNILELLPENKFVRIHKSYIVSIPSIFAVKGNEVFVTVNGSQKNIPIGVTYKEQLIKILNI